MERRRPPLDLRACIDREQRDLTSDVTAESFSFGEVEPRWSQRVVLQGIIRGHAGAQLMTEIVKPLVPDRADAASDSSRD